MLTQHAGTQTTREKPLVTSMDLDNGQLELLLLSHAGVRMVLLLY